MYLETIPNIYKYGDRAYSPTKEEETKRTIHIPKASAHTDPSHTINYILHGLK